MNGSRRNKIGALIIAALLVLSAVVVTWFFLGANPEQPLGEAVIEDRNGDRLTVEPTNDTTWSLLEELHGNGTWMWIGGLVETYDNPWDFRFVPESISVAGDTDEGSQSTIQEIHEEFEYWLDHGPVYVNATVIIIDGLPAFLGAANNYTIEGTLHTNNNTLDGWVCIDYINSAIDTLDEIVFHIYPNAFQPEGGIIIKSVKYQGENLSYSIEGSDSTVLRVDMISGLGPGPLDFGDTVTIEIDFQILIPETPDRFGWFYDDAPVDLLVYNFGNWYPIASVYDERGWHIAPYTFNSETFYSEVAMYNVSLTVPVDYVVAATGELQSSSQELDERTWVWSAGPSHDFAWVASPDLLTESVEVNGVTITSYHTTEHAGLGSQVLSNSVDALQVYEGLFGSYPWETLRIVETISSVAMEYPQLVMMTSSTYDSPEILERFIAHEVGHQWVPFAIGVDSFSEPWIDEGFATYSELCYYEYVYDDAKRQSHRETLRNGYWAHVFDWGDDSLNHSMDYWIVASGYGAIVYEKASLVFDMLRHQIGNETFYEAWQHIYQEYLHRNINFGILKQIFESTAGQSLDWFFHHWVDGEGVVTFNIVEATAQLNGGDWNLDFQLNQTGAVLVSLLVPVRVNYSGGSEIFWVLVSDTSQTFHSIPIDFAPTTIELDPDVFLLCRYGVSEMNVTI
jgi:hypothetical protein